jgi:hypothetical protein
MQNLTTEVLVVGGGTGGAAAAIQAARRGANVILVSEFSWLGGMLTAAGVSAPDGNELAAFQTGIWGAFLQELQQRQSGGLDHAWVSFFTYEPRIGAEIFADWVRALPNLKWMGDRTPQSVLKRGDRITGVCFEDVTIHASIVLDGTELGDLLALAEIPQRWGWEWRSQWQEPSAPEAPTELTAQYPVQSPTWVVVMQDFGEGYLAPEILAPSNDDPNQFIGTWDGYGAETFLNYGRLPQNRFMMNFPQRGNDYGKGLHRLVESREERSQFLQEARWHSQSYARFLQTHFGRRYGLAIDVFPDSGAFALHPYYRESRRLQGMVTVTELDILPIAGGTVATLPTDEQGQVTAIALGNYANDHHYPGYEFALQPKSVRWGGRWTGTPFTVPYGCLVPAVTDGLLVCEKNISVSHIANGATRLQPIVLGIGQAAGMAAALCIEQNCQPRDLSIRALQEALLTDAIAPTALIPLFNLPPQHPDWLFWQRYYLDHPDAYPPNGYAPVAARVQASLSTLRSQAFSGIFQRRGEQDYELTVMKPAAIAQQTFSLVTLDAIVNGQLQQCQTEQPLQLAGRLNRSGNWILVNHIIGIA